MATPEPNEIDVLIPRVRRALDGPTATSTASPSTTLTDVEVKNLIADAISDVIFFTGGDFPHTLDVAARDSVYGAPEDWRINPPLSEAEGSVVAAQAALSYFFFELRDIKTDESISDEGQAWSYSRSPNLIRDQLAWLRALRDQALEQVRDDEGVVYDAYESFVHSRDEIASRYVESWLYGSATG